MEEERKMQMEDKEEENKREEEKEEIGEKESRLNSNFSSYSHVYQ